MNKKAVANDLGKILQIFSGLLFISIPLSLIFGEIYAVPAFLITGFISFFLGYGLQKTYEETPQPSKVDSMITAALGWLIISLFGSIPFLIIAFTIEFNPTFLKTPELGKTLIVYKNPINGFFESVAGFTGTGLTVTLHENNLPASLQWWRSLTQWVGGVGVIVLTTAILERPGSGSFTLYNSEARSEKIHPSIVSTVRSIWWIITAYTIISILIFYFAGMPIWDAINHAMTGITTGGFSVTDNSLATYNNPLIEFAALPIMIFGGIAFTTHYSILRFGKIKEFIKDLQTRWFLLLISIGSLGVFLSLTPINGLKGITSSLRAGVFQFISAISCTGFQTATDLKNWPIATHLILVVGMIIGGVAGSTAGGIKIIRFATLLKGIKWRINDVFYPESAIRQLKIDQRTLSENEANEELEEAIIISILWVIFLFLGILILSITISTESFTLKNILFEVASAQGNVGLSTGITGPSMPSLSKLMLIFNMWIGRLEIIPIIIFLESLLQKI